MDHCGWVHRVVFFDTVCRLAGKNLAYHQTALAKQVSKRFDDKIRKNGAKSISQEPSVETFKICGCYLLC